MLFADFMAYLRGSSEDWDRYAGITQDEGWSWDAIQPYIRRVCFREHRCINER